MGKLVSQKWISKNNQLTHKIERWSGVYESYVPDSISDREILLRGSVAGRVSEVEGMIISLDKKPYFGSKVDALSYLLMRAEAVASSKIEGYQLSPRRVLTEEFNNQYLNQPPKEVVAQKILANIKAMTEIVGNVKKGDEITIEQVLACQSVVMGEKNKRQGLRKEQNWIKGNDFNPLGAEFIPPPPSYVPQLMKDLLAFCNNDNLPPIVQAALSHAQFETIHPFVDGNGRTGRALIHMVLQRRGILKQTILPISLMFENFRPQYLNNLQNYRFVKSDFDKKYRTEGIKRDNAWISFFAEVCLLSIINLKAFTLRLKLIKKAWLKLIPFSRESEEYATLILIIDFIIVTPLTNAHHISQAINQELCQVNLGIRVLSDIGILKEINGGKRNRVFLAREIISELELFRKMGWPKK